MSSFSNFLPILLFIRSRDSSLLVANNMAKALNELLITTNPVITEVCHILLKRDGINAQLSFMNMYQLGAFEVFELQKQHRKPDLIPLRF